MSHNDGDVLLRLIALAANADNSEIQYNCAGTIGQLTLTGALHVPVPSIRLSIPLNKSKKSKCYVKKSLLSKVPLYQNRIIRRHFIFPCTFRNTCRFTVPLYVGYANLFTKFRH